MHHHVSHEPYVDLNLPPEVVLDRYYTRNHPAEARPITNGSDRDHPPPVHTVQHSDERAISEEDSPQEQDTFHDIHPEFPNDISPENHPRTTVLSQDHEPPPPPPSPTAQQTPAVQNADLYRRRMLAHIGDLRNFSYGLEYQLQFTDFLFLEELEREGARFFHFMRECLKKEGQLVSTDQDTVPLTSPTHSTPSESHSNRMAQPAMASLQQRPFETIPGINPLAR